MLLQAFIFLQLHLLKSLLHTQSRRHYGKRPGCRVSHILINIIDIGSHRRDHSGQTGRLGQIRYNLTTLYTGVVVFVNKKRFNHDQNLKS